jgi:hypothetical protein
MSSKEVGGGDELGGRSSVKCEETPHLGEGRGGAGGRRAQSPHQPNVNGPCAQGRSPKATEPPPGSATLLLTLSARY